MPKYPYFPHPHTVPLGFRRTLSFQLCLKGWGGGLLHIPAATRKHLPARKHPKHVCLPAGSSGSWPLVMPSPPQLFHFQLEQKCPSITNSYTALHIVKNALFSFFSNERHGMNNIFQIESQQIKFTLLWLQDFCFVAPVMSLQSISCDFFPS